MDRGSSAVCGWKSEIWSWKMNNLSMENGVVFWKMLSRYKRLSIEEHLFVVQRVQKQQFKTEKCVWWKWSATVTAFLQILEQVRDTCCCEENVHWRSSQDAQTRFACVFPHNGRRPIVWGPQRLPFASQNCTKSGSEGEEIWAIDVRCLCSLTKGSFRGCKRKETDQCVSRVILRDSGLVFPTTTPILIFKLIFIALFHSSNCNA